MLLAVSENGSKRKSKNVKRMINVPRKPKVVEWKNDKAIAEWFTKIGNKRTIKNYNNEFKFLEFVREHSNTKHLRNLNRDASKLEAKTLRNREYFEGKVF